MCFHHVCQMFPDDFWTRSLIPAQSDTGLSAGSSYKCHTSRGMGGRAAISWGSPELTSAFIRLQGEASWRGNAKYRWSWKHPFSPSGDTKCSQGLSNRSEDWCIPAWVPSVNCCKHRWRCTQHGARGQHPVQVLQPSLTAWPPLLPFSLWKMTSKWTCCHFLHPPSICCCWSLMAYALLVAIRQIYMSKDDWRYICLFLIYEISMWQKGDWVKRQKHLLGRARKINVVFQNRTNLLPLKYTLLFTTKIHLPWEFYLVGQKKLEGKISSYQFPSDKWTDPGRSSLMSRTSLPSPTVQAWFEKYLTETINCARHHILV